MKKIRIPAVLIAGFAYMAIGAVVESLAIGGAAGV